MRAHVAWCRVPREVSVRTPTDPTTNQHLPADTVLAAVEVARLPEILLGIHQGGFGSAARVLDPTRGATAGQLQRAGYRIPAEIGANPDFAVVLIHAPGKAEFIGTCLRRLQVTIVYQGFRADGSLAPMSSLAAD